MAEVPSTFLLKQGQSAPFFTLPAPDGTVVSRDDIAGEAGLLVVFACNHCPYVVHLADALGNFAREVADRGVATVAIMSNDFRKYEQDAPELMQGFASNHGWDFPYLVDEDQAVAKAYGAACTPDFFLFDQDLKLYYAGQFDDSRPRSGHEPDGKDLGEAVRRMIAGEAPSSKIYPSSGCNIKWHAGNEPQWFTPK
jgi:peroxiredoxin